MIRVVEDDASGGKILGCLVVPSFLFFFGGGGGGEEGTLIKIKKTEDLFRGPQTPRSLPAVGDVRQDQGGQGRETSSGESGSLFWVCRFRV